MRPKMMGTSFYVIKKTESVYYTKKVATNAKIA